MRKIGYARVSTSAQNLDRQIGALRAERCHEVYREKASGKAVKDRPQLEKAIDALGTGDVLVVLVETNIRYPTDVHGCAR
jgi:DNA invertase Pin-like site-specific DNA recombinase